MIDIFIDESGIHKEVDNSSFVLVYIETSDKERIEKQIEKIEEELGIKTFHWAETIWALKEEFMKKALKLNFKVKIAIVKNPVKPDKEMERVLVHTIIEKNINNVIIDGKKPKWYEREIKHILRDKGLSTRKLRTINDEQSPGIRLADMVAGLTRTYYDLKNRKRIEPYFAKLRKKIIVIIE